MFIIKPTLTEEETKAQVEAVKATIEKNGGEIVATDDMGARDLAYEIDGKEDTTLYSILKHRQTQLLKLKETTESMKILFDLSL
jgi:small subunit ribosomal protein S6